MRWSIALRRLQVAGQYSSGAWGGLPQHLQLRNADGQEGDLQITNKRQQVRIAWFSFILSGFLINVVHSPHSLVRLVVVLNTKKNVESYILSLCDSEFWETTSELLKVSTKTLVIDFVRSFLSPLAVSRVSLVFSLNFCNICDIICPETMLSMPMTVCLVSCYVLSSIPFTIISLIVVANLVKFKQAKKFESPLLLFKYSNQFLFFPAELSTWQLVSLLKIQQIVHFLLSNLSFGYSNACSESIDFTACVKYLNMKVPQPSQFYCNPN